MIKQLARYMRYRANIEGVKYALPDDFLQDYFDRGTRHFFGVTLN